MVGRFVPPRDLLQALVVAMGLFATLFLCLWQDLKEINE